MLIIGSSPHCSSERCPWSLFHLATRVGKGYRPTGATIPARIVSQKNQGTYGSGVNDVVVELERAGDSRTVAGWADGAVVRLIPQAGR